LKTNRAISESGKSMTTYCRIDAVSIIKFILKSYMARLSTPARITSCGDRRIGTDREVSVCQLYEFECEPPLEKKGGGAPSQDEAHDHHRCNLKRETEHSLEVGASGRTGEGNGG
jgi:hypothetical protein